MTAGYEIVDCHIHLFRDTEQEKQRFHHKGWPDSWYTGSEATVESYMDCNGFSSMWCMNVIPARWIDADLAREGDKRTAKDLTKEERKALIKAHNRWAVGVGQRHPRLPQFIMADPVTFGKGLVDEVEECLKLGARGLKVHPRHCGHYPDFPDMYPVYDLCQTRGIPLLADTGGKVENGVRPTTEPIFWEPVLRKFPKLRLIIAHLGSELWDQRIELATQFKGDNLAFDTAGGLVDAQHPPYVHREMEASRAVEVFRKIGIERVMFGSDGFFSDPMIQARQIVALDLTDAEKERILCANAKDYLGLN
jgi:predicted TIM-barrel fold metal-dependent hydrolase